MSGFRSFFSHSYYHSCVAKTFNFIVPPNKKILFFGCLDGTLLANLSPSVGIGLEIDEKLVKRGLKKYPKLQLINLPYEKYRPKEKFDFIILNGALGQSKDLMSLLKALQPACHPSTRILVYQHNHLWQWFLEIAESLKIKRNEGIRNWLSIGDTSVYLSGSGFEVTRVFKRTIFPTMAFGLGPLFNFLSIIFPFIDFLKLDQYLIARPLPELFSPQNQPKSLTICITVRNEKENIEGIVKNIPIICPDQEILFVEGHSTDGTKEEIERMIKRYPNKHIWVMGQPGKGQGDAIRVGFKAAKGDIIILYEGDGTSDPGDLIYFYEALKQGRFEFIEGSRFVYPLKREAMPLPNMLGNIFFAKWFSFFLGQRTTDVLSGIKGILKKDYALVFERWGFLGLQDPFGDFELLYGSARMGLKIGEIPMRYYPRIYGQSKSNVLKHGLYLIQMAARGYLIFRKN